MGQRRSLKSHRHLRLARERAASYEGPYLCSQTLRTRDTTSPVGLVSSLPNTRASKLPHFGAYKIKNAAGATTPNNFLGAVVPRVEIVL